MNLYHLEQEDNCGYDTYSDCVVCAENENQAKKMHPNPDVKWQSGMWYNNKLDCSHEETLCSYDADWANSPDTVTCKLIGKAAPGFTEPKVIISSYHAG
jgi:hypothetical protein